MTSLRAGYAERVITPPLGSALIGYGYYIDRRAETVLDDLKVRAIALRRGKGSALLVSCDLLGFSIEFSDAVRSRLASKQNLNSTNILLSCTHTHSGPSSQPMRGFAGVDDKYLRTVTTAIEESAASAFADQREAECSYRFETVEPIGFNRQKKNFETIDPVLKVVILKRGKEKLYLLSYACHPVTLGVTKEISADWPGALIQKIEENGHRGICFQGFCGDIDPVNNHDRWGKGTQRDLRFYGNMLYEGMLRAEDYAVPIKDTTIKSVEKRIELPLKVPSKKEIEEEENRWLKNYKGNAAVERFIKDWAREATNRHAKYQENPCLPNVPIQVISIGELKILGLPGEVFAVYHRALQKENAPVLTLGFANGNVGYLPTDDAYQIVDDYACYQSSKFYNLFPFTKDVETAVLQKSREALNAPPHSQNIPREA